MTTMPGMVRMTAKSSLHWWEAPSSPTEMPPWVAPIFTFRWGYPTVLRICSKARPAANMAKEEAKGTKPVVLRPAATPTMSASAMPQSMWRSGNAFLKMLVLVAPARSASSTTRLGISPPSSVSALP